jgi:hypothetical protein
MVLFHPAGFTRFILKDPVSPEVIDPDPVGTVVSTAAPERVSREISPSPRITSYDAVPAK